MAFCMQRNLLSRSFGLGETPSGGHDTAVFKKPKLKIEHRAECGFMYRDSVFVSQVARRRLIRKSTLPLAYNHAENEQRCCRQN